ncbi:Protein kinase-like domain protein [Niveomyces insectorum RCEF 264]|uniref:Protein kinase-like domain protein n=1 Tax=Niveomyces insectorum RCEF 264 TaxID=1081102 RepID=A0A167LSM6_9HYPO|nr:Protein kinase-like domain protein [Niveomyces insectorum RCEF 264]
MDQSITLTPGKGTSSFAMLPLSFRLRMGRKFFKYLTPTVVQVSPHRIIKGPCHPSELEAMLYVKAHTTIPVPKVYRTHTTPKGNLYIEMEYVEGTSLAELWMKEGLSDDEKKSILADIQNAVAQLRSLPPPRDDIVTSASTTGSIWDARIGPDVVGPFESHGAFHSFLRGGVPLQHATGIFGAVVVEAHTKRYRTRFAHADLVPRNIIIHKGSVAAVVDWAFSGWFPEYWEFTKAHYGLFPRQDWYEALYEAMPRYDAELAAERVLWRLYEEPGIPRHVSGATKGTGVYFIPKK